MSTIDELLSKARGDVRSLNKGEMDLIANNFHASTSAFMCNCNDAAGAKEARDLLMSAEKKETMVVAQQQIMDPGTNWDAYVANENDAREKRRVEQVARMEDFDLKVTFDKVNEQHNALLDKMVELHRQLKSLGEYEFGTRLSHLIIEILENLRSNENKLRDYVPYKEAFGGYSTQAPAYSFRAASSQRSTVRPFRANLYPLSLGPPHRRPLPAYMFFANEVREKVRGEHPEISLGQVKKRMGELWKAMSEDERAPYEAEAAADAAAKRN